MIRSPLLLLLASLLVKSAAAAGDMRFDFDVLLDTRPIGTHAFRIQSSADGTQQVSSVAQFNVKMLGLVVYRYRHEANERWDRGCLTQMEATTSDNGNQLQVAGSRFGVRFQLTRPDSSVARDGCVISYAYWDKARLLQQHELLNPQTGAFDAVRIEPLGEETLVVGGNPVTADRYRLRNGKLVIDLWYSKAGQWLQLQSSTDSKRQLHYRLRNRNPDDEQRAGLAVLDQ